MGGVEPTERTQSRKGATGFPRRVLLYLPGRYRVLMSPCPSRRADLWTGPSESETGPRSLSPRDGRLLRLGLDQRRSERLAQQRARLGRA
jgi:hypothetical protein